MKRTTLLSITLFTLMIGEVKAQKDTHFSDMQKEISALKRAKSQSDFLTVAQAFEQLSNVTPESWQALYFSAYASLWSGILSKDKIRQDEQYDRSLELLENAQKQWPKNSELFALKGYIRYMKIALDPMNRYKGRAEAERDLEIAEDINPDNPRIFLIRGQNKLYTPKAYGGGPEVARPLLEKAKKLFDSGLVKRGSIDPQWGRERTVQLLEQ